MKYTDYNNNKNGLKIKNMPLWNYQMNIISKKINKNKR